MSLIVARDIWKTYTTGAVEVPAVRGVSFDIDVGAFLAFVGPSGNGKTTLLNLIGCLDKPTSDSLAVAGVDVIQRESQQRGEPSIQLFPPAVPRPAPRRARATRLSPACSACPGGAVPHDAALRAMTAGGCFAQESPPSPRARGSRWRRHAAEGGGTKKAFLFPMRQHQLRDLCTNASRLRSWLHLHRGISQEKLPLYLGFFEFVHNVRKRGKALLGSLIALLVSKDPGIQ